MLAMSSLIVSGCAITRSTVQPNERDRERAFAPAGPVQNLHARTLDRAVDYLLQEDLHTSQQQRQRRGGAHAIARSRARGAVQYILVDQVLLHMITRLTYYMRCAREFPFPLARAPRSRACVARRRRAPRAQPHMMAVARMQTGTGIVVGW